MAIEGIKQPDVIVIDESLRLCKTITEYKLALSWYQDTETVWLVDGVREPYTIKKLQRMYAYLRNHGELYFIEVWENGEYHPIGDVTFSFFDLPIVIGEKQYRNKGIAKKVLLTLIQRGKELGAETLCVREIYRYNIASQKLFESVGFYRKSETEKGYGYCLKLS